jgi:hypothetical protein
MAAVRRPLELESGLVGKLILAWLLVAAVLIVLAMDVGSILLARYRAADIALEVAFAAAETFAETGDGRPPASSRSARSAERAPTRAQRLDVNGARSLWCLLSGPTLLLGRFRSPRT